MLARFIHTAAYDQTVTDVPISDLGTILKSSNQHRCKTDYSIVNPPDRLSDAGEILVQEKLCSGTDSERDIVHLYRWMHVRECARRQG